MTVTVQGDDLGDIYRKLHIRTSLIKIDIKDVPLDGRTKAQFRISYNGETLVCHNRQQALSYLRSIFLKFPAKKDRLFNVPLTRPRKAPHEHKDTVSRRNRRPNRSR